MKKTVKKGLILLLIFLLALAGYFVWFFVRRDDRGTAYTSIEDADLPVACVELFGRRMNPMKGFVEDNPRAAGRADLTVLPEDLRLPVVFEEVNSTVSGIQYEIRSLDGERLVERTVLESWEQADREVRATLEIQNLLTKGEEYRLTLAIATGEHPAVYYYTRIVWTDAVQMAQMTDLACSFSEKSFDYAAARDLTTYLETNPDADNSSLGHVTLKNDFNQLTWRSLAIRPYGEVSVHLRELQGSMGCIDLEYVAAETGEDGTERFYDVTESFTMRQGAERIYMMNYDRRTNEIFTFFPAGGLCWEFQTEKICRQSAMPRGAIMHSWRTGFCGVMMKKSGRAPRCLPSARARRICATSTTRTESVSWRSARPERSIFWCTAI